MKRFFAIVLCLAMLMSYAVPTAYATGNTTDGTDDIYFADGSTINNITTDAEDEDTLSPVVGNTSGEEKLPVCDCGADAEMVNHADTCTLKRYYMGISTQNAAEIYTQWESFPEDVRSYILQYLSWNDQEKLAYLQSMLNTDLSGKDTAQVDGAVINVSNIPAGGSVTVVPVRQTRSAVTSSVTDEVNELLAERRDKSTQLFMWDISVQDPNGDEWQPFATPVTVEVTIPGVKLHKYTEVFVIHVGDDGEAEYVNAKVTENGGIAFETSSFSTFAGFTVDFEYGAAYYSINGKTSILLSELFDALQMPLFVSDVADVVFTNYDLISLTEQADGDWLLTSLVAFDTTEGLTVTMNDGKVYEIKVTDAAVQIMHGDDKTDLDGGGNDEVNWYLKGSGKGGKGYAKADTNDTNLADGWSEDKIIKVSGNGTFYIKLQRHKGASGATIYCDIRQIQVLAGAKLEFSLGSTINKNGYTDADGVKYAATTEVQLRVQKNDRTEYNTGFLVDSGSLSLTGKSGVKFSFRGGGTDYADPLINAREGSTGLSVKYVTFEQTQNGAIRCSGNTVTNLTVENCNFEDTVYKKADHGGAIYVDEASNVGNYVVDITTMSISNCTFSGNKTEKRGGAVAVIGRIKNITFNGCTFENCKAENGGAIALGGTIDKAVIAGCTFTGCSATVSGGAVDVWTRVLTQSGDTGRYSRINKLEIRYSETYSKNTTFTSCSAGDHGGALILRSQLHTATVSGVTFTTCTAAYGGAVTLSSSDAAVNLWEYQGTGFAETKNDNAYNWGTDGVKTTVNTAEITGCTFTSCSSTNSGGGIEYATNAYITSAKLNSSNFNSCTTQWSGSAVYLGGCIIPAMTVNGTNFDKCDFKGATATTTTGGFFGDKVYTYPKAEKDGQGGGTFRTIGETTVALQLTGCTFSNNKSRLHGGGLYWNSNYSRAGVTCQATVKQCTFDGNTAVEYGGGIYCEAVMTTSGCTFYDNVAY